MSDGQWHRVCLNTIVRKDKNLESERLRILPMGSRVRVVERSDRRVRIDQPIAGWCSLKSSNGDTILTPLDQDEVAIATPQGTDAATKFKKEQNKWSNKMSTLEQQKKQLEDNVPDNEVGTKIKESLKKLQELETELREKEQGDHIKQELYKELQSTDEEIKKRQQEESAQKEEIAKLQSQIDSLKKQGQDPEMMTKVDKLQKIQDELAEAEKKRNDAKRNAERAQQEMEQCKEEMHKITFSFDKETEETDEYEPGDVVMVKKGLGVVVVRYFGPVKGMGDEKYLGVELSDPIGDTTGTIDGQTYFKVAEDFGLFIQTHEVKKKITPEQLLHQLHGVLRNLQRSVTAKE